MNNKSVLKVLKTTVMISKTLNFLCAFSTAVTAVTAIWAICNTAKKICG